MNDSVFVSTLRCTERGLVQPFGTLAWWVSISNSNLEVCHDCEYHPKHRANTVLSAGTFTKAYIAVRKSKNKSNELIERI